MTTSTEQAKTLNDTRQRAWLAGNEVLERAELEGRGLTAEEKAAVRRADHIAAECTSLRDELTERYETQRDLEGITDEFRRVGVRPDISQARALARFATGDDEQGKPNAIAIDLAPAARAWQAYRTGARGLELRAFTGDSSSATGGSLTTPTDVSLNIYSTMVNAVAMRRTRATIVTTTGGNKMRFPRTVTHSIGTQVAGQTTSFAGTDAVLGMMELGAWDAAELVALSSDLLDDSGADVLGFIARDVGRALGVLTGGWYVTGNGSTQPTGLITAAPTGAAGTIATGSTTALGASGQAGEKLWDVVFSIDDGYRRNGAEWIMRDLTGQTIRKIRDGAGGTSGRFMFEPSPTSGIPGGTPDTLCGFPIHFDSNVASMASDATVAAFGDLSSYYIRDVRGVQLGRSDTHRFDKNQIVIRSLLRTDAGLIDATAVNVLHQAAS